MVQVKDEQSKQTKSCFSESSLLMDTSGLASNESNQVTPTSSYSQGCSELLDSPFRQRPNQTNISQNNISSTSGISFEDPVFDDNSIGGEKDQTPTFDFESGDETSDYEVLNEFSSSPQLPRNEFDTAKTETCRRSPREHVGSPNNDAPSTLDNSSQNQRNNIADQFSQRSNSLTAVTTSSNAQIVSILQEEEQNTNSPHSNTSRLSSVSSNLSISTSPQLSSSSPDQTSANRHPQQLSIDTPDTQDNSQNQKKRRRKSDLTPDKNCEVETPDHHRSPSSTESTARDQTTNSSSNMEFLAFPPGSTVDPTGLMSGMAHYGISAPGSATTAILDANGMQVGIAVSGGLDHRVVAGGGSGAGTGAAGSQGSNGLEVEESCPVCGDKVSGYHYGLMTCESCKGFFKRTVQNNKVYQCIENKDCRIDKSQRKRCPYCRFQKCLSVGMKLEAVRADRMRGGRNKFGPMYKRDRAIKQQQKAIRQQMIQVAMHSPAMHHHHHHHANAQAQIQAALSQGSKIQTQGGTMETSQQVVVPCPPVAPVSGHLSGYCPTSVAMMGSNDSTESLGAIKLEPHMHNAVISSISANHASAANHGMYSNVYSMSNLQQVNLQTQTSAPTLISPTEYQHYIQSAALASQQQQELAASSMSQNFAFLHTGSMNNNSVPLSTHQIKAGFFANSLNGATPNTLTCSTAFLNGSNDFSKQKMSPSPPMKEGKNQFFENGDKYSQIPRMRQVALNVNPPKLLLELSTSEPLTETIRARVMSSWHYYMESGSPFSMFVRGLEQLLFCFVDWARSSCFFKELQVEDQMKLLQSSWSNLVLFDHIYRQLKHSPSSHAPRIVLITGHVLDVRILQLHGLHEAAEKFIALADFLRNIDLEFYEYVAIKFLLLLNPNVANLSDKMYVERSQQHINSCLMDYCLQTHPESPERFQFLILQLKELSALAGAFEEYLVFKQNSAEIPSNSLISEMLQATRKSSTDNSPVDNRGAFVGGVGNGGITAGATSGVFSEGNGAGSDLSPPPNLTGVQSVNGVSLAGQMNGATMVTSPNTLSAVAQNSFNPVLLTATTVPQNVIT